tara:strand:- start:61 stop:801 length:741 start_codon:yes stop_codon:yes gene_type:complete
MLKKIKNNKDKTKVLAIFLARGGSRRIKNKNIVSFFGKPIIYYGLNAAKKSKIFSEIFISTDSQKIKKIVEKKGFKVKKLRSKKLARDNVNSLVVIKKILDDYEKENINFDCVFNIFPASPLLKPKDLEEAFKIFKKNKMKKPLYVFSKYLTPIEWAFRKRKNIFIPKKPKLIMKNSLTFKESFYESGPFTIFPTKYFKKKNYLKNSSKGFLGYELPNFRSIDIDTKEDLFFAKVLYLGLNKKTSI